MENVKPEKRTDVTIENNVASFTISHQSLTQGTLIGTFTFRTFLLPLQRLEAGRDRRRLLGEFEQFSTPEERYLAFIISELKQRVLTSPSWFSQTEIMAGNLPEESLLYKVGDAALYAETLYQEQKEEEKKKLLDRAMAEAANIIKKREEAKQAELKKAKEASLEFDDLEEDNAG